LKKELKTSVLSIEAYKILRDQLKTDKKKVVAITALLKDIVFNKEIEFGHYDNYVTD